MNRYAIVTIDRSGRVGFVPFESLPAIEAYKVARAELLAELSLWYVVEIIERSSADVSAGVDLFAYFRE